MKDYFPVGDLAKARFECNREAWALLELINAEFQSDPMAVQCFDLRIVKRLKEIIVERRELDRDAPMQMLGGSVRTAEQTAPVEISTDSRLKRHPGAGPTSGLTY